MAMLRNGIYGTAVLAVSLFATANAYAVSERVKSACRNDYFEHCSQYAVGSEELRQCMRKVGEDLSAPCLVALVQEGEITKADVERHNAAKTAAPKKQSTELASKTADDPKDVSGTTKKHKAEKKKKTAVAEAQGSESAVAQSDKSEKSAKSAEAENSATGTKTSKKSAKKKKHKKSKATDAASSSTTSETAATADAKATSPKTKKHHHTKTKSAAKKKSADTTTQTKKTSKTKKSKKHAAKPADAGSP